MLPLMLLLLVSGAGVAASRLPMLLQPSAENQDSAARVFFQVGSKEEDLPECGPWAVCNKVDLYDSPWVEKQCRCPSKSCSSSLHASDGHTVTDKMRLFKLCESTKKLPYCRFFRDYTWTLRTSPDNVTEQVMHCHCPQASAAYLVKRQTYQTPQGLGYQYLFACSPQGRIVCKKRKEPCRLFTVRKRHEVEEVNLNSLCMCPNGHRCPRHHLEAGVVAGKSYAEEAIHTYSGYCVPS